MTHCATYIYISDRIPKQCGKGKVITERLNHLENRVFLNRWGGNNNGPFYTFRKYTMDFFEQMGHDGKGIMLTLTDILGHNSCQQKLIQQRDI